MSQRWCQLCSPAAVETAEEEVREPAGASHVVWNWPKKHTPPKNIQQLWFVHSLLTYVQLTQNNLNIRHDPACSVETGKQSFPRFVRNCQVYIARLQLLAAMVTEAKPAQSASNSWTVHFKDVPCAGWCPTWEQGGFAPGSYSAAGNGLAMGPTKELTGIIRCRSIWWSWIHCRLGWGSTTRMARSGKMPGPKFQTLYRQMDAIGSVILIHARPTVLSNIYLIFLGVCLTL